MVKKKNIDELVENEITGTAKELRKALRTVKAPVSDKNKLLSSGFVPLNLASTNCHHGFIAPGEDCIIFGDSASGKTWLYLQILAEAASNPNFDDYGMAIAKAHSQNTRRVVAGLRKTGSILIRVAQSRDNVTGYGASKTYAGGRALKFYSHLEIQTSVAGQIKKTHNERVRVAGTVCRIQILKNRHSGQRPEVLMPIYNQSGVDSVGGTLEWLIEEKVIAREKGKQSLSIPALNLTGTLEKIVRTIEEEEREAELCEFAQQAWNDILQSVALQRKRRYE